MAALEIGRATADQLAKHAKIVRSTTYVQLDSLMKKGLMSTYEEGKKTFFAPESPEYLKRIFELKKKEFEVRERELNDFLPTLIKQFEGAGERPVVRFYDGKQGIETVRAEALSVKDKTIRVIYSYRKFREIFSSEELEAYSKMRSAAKIQSKIIYTNREEPDPDYKPFPLTAVKFLPQETLDVSSDILVFDDRVAFIVLEGALHAVVIEDKLVARTMKSLFDYYWRISKAHVYQGEGAEL